MLQLFVCPANPEAIMMSAKRFCMNKKHRSQSRNFTRREVQLQKKMSHSKHSRQAGKELRFPSFPGNAPNSLCKVLLLYSQNEIKK